jgi:RhtB (resistance to homoserine/threonine) family protein
MHDYWIEFGKVALAHALAVASPGPDFAIVVKQSLAHGRRTAITTSLGVGAAISLHVGYSLLGLGLLLRSSALWFDGVKYVGAAYIAWIGVQSLRARPRQAAVGVAAENTAPPSPRSAFAVGFLTNALNPKVTLFFLSLFILIVDPATPKLIQAGYGLWMVLATMGWFSLVSVFFTRADVRGKFQRYGHWIDWALGVVCLAFAARLAVAAAA